MAPSQYQRVCRLGCSPLGMSLTPAQLDTNEHDDTASPSTTTIPPHDMTSDSLSRTVASSFEPPQNDDVAAEDTDTSSEHQRLMPTETDPARFGIHVQPTSHIRQLISHGNDGVFSNMSAKPEIGQIKEEHPPVSIFKTPPTYRS